MLVPSELLLSTHLPTTEGWTAELTVGLWLVVPTVGLERRTERRTCEFDIVYIKKCSYHMELLLPL